MCLALDYTNLVEVYQSILWRLIQWERGKLIEDYLPCTLQINSWICQGGPLHYKIVIILSLHWPVVNLCIIVVINFSPITLIHLITRSYIYVIHCSSSPFLNQTLVKEKRDNWQQGNTKKQTKWIFVWKIRKYLRIGF